MQISIYSKYPHSLLNLNLQYQTDPPKYSNMFHPIHHANENSPFGDLTRDEFYKAHNILHQECFMVNKRNMKIFTQTWSPAAANTGTATRLRGLIAMIHGYMSETSWIFQLTAVAFAKAGYFVCSLDLQGHGYSEGLYGHIPKIRPVIDDCIQFFDSVKTRHSKLPSFLYGESLGGAIAMLIALEQQRKWNGLILNGALCGISAKYKPAWPLQMLLPVVAFFAPTWRIVITKPLASRSYKEEWKRKLVGKSPNRKAHGKPPAATALEFLSVCEEIGRRCHELELPMLVVHGEDDSVSDPNSARLVYELARSNDKSLKIFPGMWHQLIGESKEGVEQVFGIIFSWIRDRSDKMEMVMINNYINSSSESYIEM